MTRAKPARYAAGWGISAKTVRGRNEAIMTKTSKAKLAYMAEYQKRPENVKKRVERNAARREALREGAVHKGDGKEIDHKKPLDQGGDNSKSNRRVVDASENRGWRKRQPGMYGKNK